MNLAKVAIIGRMNVGKSTLFNRLAVNARSITYDFAGVTRDIIKDVINWRKCTFELIDTGGISFRKVQDPIMEQVRIKALEVVHSADLLLFMVDGASGLSNEDREIANYCHKLKKQVILVINKADSGTPLEYEHEFLSLGIATSIAISATHGKGISELLDVTTQLLPETGKLQEEDPTFKIVILGKPNVGKSSLMNLLLNQERSIVNEKAGTTREPIEEKISFYQEDILVTDTPGIRRKRMVSEDLETLMVKTAFRAVERADIVLLMIDSSDKTIADQELKLAFYVFEHFKSLILLFNKDDLIDVPDKAEIRFNASVYDYFLKKIPQMYISCKNGKNIGKILPLVKKVWDHANTQISNEEVTILFKEALIHKPHYHKSSELMIYRVQQINKNPLTFTMIVNEPKWFGASQLSFFENILREKYDFLGAPIKLVTKKRA